MQNEFCLNFTGDVMLGRLVDQLFPTHVDNAEDQAHAESFVARFPHLQSYSPSSPWGSTLPLFTESHLNLINLETTVTTNPEAWPGKTFNYRMHPVNASATLAAAHIDFASLANNHTLDFGTEGLVETAWTLKNDSRVGIAGAGETTQEAISPATLELPRSKSQGGVKQGGRPTALSAENQKERCEKHIVHVYAASDHPLMWNDVPMFHLIDYSDKTKAHLKRVVEKHSSFVSISASPSSTPSSSTSRLDSVSNESSPPSLKIFSIHWGPNYSWHPADKIRSMAHFLIFDCGIDIVHGHSSHHIQGVECPAPGKLIIYGCGDFVDDYATNEKYRNDLGAVYRVIVREESREGNNETGPTNAPLTPVRLEIFPTSIKLFQAHLLSNTKDKDHKWVCERIRTLTGELAKSEHSSWAGKRNLIRSDLGKRGQIIMDLI
jgi:poly-gamma-glutamate capsule biosynthesis protein CapA/YwtB (metallophosphatase superfamily)